MFPEYQRAYGHIKSRPSTVWNCAICFLISFLQLEIIRCLLRNKRFSPFMHLAPHDIYLRLWHLYLSFCSSMLGGVYYFQHHLPWCWKEEKVIANHTSNFFVKNAENGLKGGKDNSCTNWQHCWEWNCVDKKYLSHEKTSLMCGNILIQYPDRS